MVIGISALVLTVFHLLRKQISVYGAICLGTAVFVSLFLLDAAGIEARPLWKPMHKQSVYRGTPTYVNGVSKKLFKVGIGLPSGSCVSDEDERYIVGKIKEEIVG